MDNVINVTIRQLGLSQKQQDHFIDLAKRITLWVVIIAIALGIVVGLAVFATGLSSAG